MIHLAKHIELLLLDNDCVIIPRVGGFVAHYTPAKIEKDEQIIQPPFRTIGFNPQLKINDGVLAESYMNLYGINFNEANKRMDSEIDELLSVLHENGQYNFVNIGELHYNIYGIYEFSPYDNMLTSPTLYGLTAFVLNELKDNSEIDTSTFIDNQSIEEHKKFEYDEEDESTHKAYIIRLNRTFVRSAVAVAAIIALLFTFSTPISNNNILSENQAKLIPDELLNQLKSKSILNNIIDIPGDAKTSKVKSVVAPKQSHALTIAKNTIPSPIKSHSEIVQPSAKYHLIVASSIAKKRANILAKDLREKGYSAAKVLISGKMVRVSITESNDENKAQKLLNKLSEETEYHNMWIMKEKNSSKE